MTNLSLKRCQTNIHYRRYLKNYNRDKINVGKTEFARRWEHFRAHASFPSLFVILSYVRVFICLLASALFRFGFWFLVYSVGLVWFGFWGLFPLLFMKNQCTAGEWLWAVYSQIWQVTKQAINQCGLVSLGFQIFHNNCWEERKDSIEHWGPEGIWQLYWGEESILGSESGGWVDP